MNAKAPKWIWGEAPTGKRNQWLRFRKTFVSTKAAGAILRITADSHYWLYLNGEYLGAGPVRSWPNHWKYDEYDLKACLKPGENVLAVLVTHYGEGSLQYVCADPGLWVDLLVRGKKNAACKSLLRSGPAWKTSASTALQRRAPRVSLMQGFEEQFDARLEDDWKNVGYNDSAWAHAQPVSPPHETVVPSGIPLLASEPVFPQRVIRAEEVRPLSMACTLEVKPYYAPTDRSANICFVNGFLYTQIWSNVRQEVGFLRPHHHDCPFKLNGKTIAGLRESDGPRKFQQVPLIRGWNELLLPYPSTRGSSDGIKPAGATHFNQFVLGVDCREPVRFSAIGKRRGPAWAFLGPFAFSKDQEKTTQAHMDYPRVVLPENISRDATRSVFNAIWKVGALTPEQMTAPYFSPFQEEHIVAQDVACNAFGDRVEQKAKIENENALLSNNSEWTTFHPPSRGNDLRVLVDFGREIVGHHVFEVEAAAGTIIDLYNFEFIQADGRENESEGMNNSSRYICREGRQVFRTLLRRGFRYTWLIFRRLREPLRIRALHAEFVAYPQARQGAFVSSDSLLNRIWEVGAHTLRCCSEDTYTDCPTYEQTHWVGDARNEALIDSVVNGDPRLWFRCLEQAGQSLERSPLTLSQVPSAWENVLPAWSFLWMRSCREYLLWTGDYAGARKLWPWVKRNVEGIEKHLDARCLFTMRAWNMFDWAAMDTPPDGTVTHLNCFAVLALRECVKMAEWLHDARTARRFRMLAASLARAVNRDLWSHRRKAYVDSIHRDGTPSETFSQQTQTVALISGVACGERARRCREWVSRPPIDFVKAGSPFFEFFLLELLADEGRAQDFLETIRRDWGFMIDQGATSFWEMWSLKTGRLTRSHCHGWSGAPTFFLSTRVLGITPIKPGFAEVSFDPQMGDLAFARGTVPTPHGPIEVTCHRTGSVLRKQLKLPPGVKLIRRRKTSAIHP